MVGLTFYEAVPLERKQKFAVVVDDPIEDDKDFAWLWADYEVKDQMPMAKHRVVVEDRGKQLAETDDFGTSSTEPIFSERAAEILSLFFGANGKLCPIEVVNGPKLYKFAPQPIIVIDHETQGWREGSTAVLKTWSIIHGSLDGVDIFFNSGPYRAIGYSQRFVDAWNAAGLLGMGFKPRCAV